MNLTEFAALRAGDKIDNHMSNSRGEVVDVDDKGVRVRWSVVDGQERTAATRHYSAGSTIWFHWSKVETERSRLGCEREVCAFPDCPCVPLK